MTTVYVETSILSYLTGRPSRDLLVAAHQQITQEWWPLAIDAFDCFVSDAVIDEVLRGDPVAVEHRREHLSGLRVLTLSDDVSELIRTYHGRLGLTGSAMTDLPHFAYAVAYNMDYLVTWNCKHIANGHVIRRLMEINREIGWDTPVILTPEELPVSGFGEE